MHRYANVLILGALMATGCADYAYRPSGATSAAQRVAVTQLQAPPARRGEVHVSSPGIVPMAEPVGEASKDASKDNETKALKLSFTVTNEGSHYWLIDTRNEKVIYPDGTERTPALSVSQLGTTDPLVEVPVGAARTVHLYYALPEGQEHARQLPSFTARWQVQTSHGILGGESQFHRIKIGGVTLPCGPNGSEYCVSGYAS
jgi:hypothetical protein